MKDPSIREREVKSDNLKLINLKFRKIKYLRKMSKTIIK
jgi:hypothetical protein